MSAIESQHLDPQICRQVLTVCGCHNLRRAARTVTQLYDDALQPSGLRATQVVLMVTLATDEEMNLSGLAREMALSPSTLSRNLRPLERDGLISIIEGARRRKSVRLTERGHRALVKVVPYWEKA
ncbi:MAG: MarR family winged helix-turn-helix transcriptional regulator, partial [Gammaproteobacteria bacterium]